MKKYTDAERLLIIEQHLRQGKTIKNLSMEYGISESTLGRWLVKNRNGKLAVNDNERERSKAL